MIKQNLQTPPIAHIILGNASILYNEQLLLSCKGNIRNSLMARIKAGDKAPGFTLPDTDLQPQSLKECLGQKVVLAFHVDAFTATCTKETCEFRDAMARLINSKAQIIGISTNEPFVNKVFAQRNRLTFPVLGDTKRKVIKTYGLDSADLEDLSGCSFAERSLVLVDETGIVQYVWASKDPYVEPDYKDFEETFKEPTIDFPFSALKRYKKTVSPDRLPEKEHAEEIEA
jgi:peroxiredoxin